MKALSESSEHLSLICYPELNNSSGLSCHTDFRQASQHATLELVERDAILCHPLTNSCIESLKEARLTLLGPPMGDLERDLRVRMKFGLLDSPSGDIYIVTCISFFNDSNLGIVFGLAMARKFQVAVNKVFVESLLRVCPIAIIMTDKTKNVERNSNQKKTKLMSLGPCSKTIYRLFSEHRKRLTIEVSEVFETEVINCYLPDALQAFPFTLVRASNPCLQQYYSGYAKQDLLNYDRLSDFAGKRISFDERTGSARNETFAL